MAGGGTSFPILVLGGYGEFGRRISRLLARDPALRVIVAGRSRAKAEIFAADIRREAPAARVEPLAFDIRQALPEALAETGARLVIHCVGPFQHQGYAVAETCIAAGVHYIDIADDRAFVCGFDTLGAIAEAKDVLAVSGASSVPGLSSTVVEMLRDGVDRVEAVEIAIASGNQAASGVAVIAAILGYLGRPIPRWRDGRWAEVHGWQDLRRRTIAGLGIRWLAACDVPDTALLPSRIPELRSASFHAGHELPALHFMLWGLSWLRRLRLLPSLDRFAPMFRRAALLVARFGSGRGGMSVDLIGRDAQGAPVRRNWTIVAEGGQGPWIPCLPAVILARKLASGALRPRGATPCWNLFDLDEFADALAEFDIRMTVDSTPFPAHGMAP
ncbi:MAG: saccharopine dehydrogenase NADP-binding domain-containing protein [Alphaproteobacteria bacterium]|nr:saccharopine dehydrogenase NADP-binding domain-containing protein [Alphaproteobacteria bacterium]